VCVYVRPAELDRAQAIERQWMREMIPDVPSAASAPEAKDAPFSCPACGSRISTHGSRSLSCGLEFQLRDVTRELHRYLEAKRHLWNVCFSDEVVDLRECGSLDDFELIDRTLFNALVLRKLGAEPLANDSRFGIDPIQNILVKAKEMFARLPLMVSTPQQGMNRSWQNAVFDTRGTYTFHFIEFFEWDRYSYASYPFVALRIAASDRSSELIGLDALIEVARVRMYTSAR